MNDELRRRVAAAEAEDRKISGEKWEHPTDDYSNYWERIVKAILSVESPPEPGELRERVARELWDEPVQWSITPELHPAYLRKADRILALVKGRPEPDASMVERVAREIAKVNASSAEWPEDFSPAWQKMIRSSAARICAIRDEGLMARIIERGLWTTAPCIICGYNGPGYFQPAIHPCAALARTKGD